MLWQLATEVMVKILGEADSRRRFEMVEINDWRGKIVCRFRRMQSDYSQTEYGKNTLMVGDGGDGENPRRQEMRGGGNLRV